MPSSPAADASGPPVPLRLHQAEALAPVESTVAAGWTGVLASSRGFAPLDVETVLRPAWS